MTEQRKQRLKTKLLESRFRICKKCSDFEKLVHSLFFAATKMVWRISTNGTHIYFDPDWIQKLSNESLDFVLAHQLMHIVLGHTQRPKYYKGDRFHLACDIIVNANLAFRGWEYEKLPSVGNIYTETFFPRENGLALNEQQAFRCIPFDPSELKPGKRRIYMIDSDSGWGMNEETFADCVTVLFPGDEDIKSESHEKMTFHVKHSEPYKKEVDLFEKKEYRKDDLPEIEKEQKTEKRKQSIKEKLEYLKEITSDKTVGRESDFIERVWKNIHNKKSDWQKLLHNYIENEVCDYSFTPPDRRFADFDFFMPDYNVNNEKIKKILFMVDTSGSIEDETLSLVYSEIYNAVTSLNGAVKGLLCFFDTEVYSSVMFGNIDDLMSVLPVGGGGTDFKCIFDYVKKLPECDLPSDIIVFTDGDAVFPDESMAIGISVLWLLTDDKITPPWGRCVWIG